MTARAAHILVNVPDHQLRMAAEVLGCYSTDPEQRRQHRLAKINSFPESERATIKQLVNQVLIERQMKHSKESGESICSS